MFAAFVQLYLLCITDDSTLDDDNGNGNGNAIDDDACSLNELTFGFLMFPLLMCVWPLVKKRMSSRLKSLENRFEDTD